jgi:hypothetical protein
MRGRGKRLLELRLLWRAVAPTSSPLGTAQHRGVSIGDARGKEALGAGSSSVVAEAAHGMGAAVVAEVRVRAMDETALEVEAAGNADETIEHTQFRAFLWLLLAQQQCDAELVL